MKWTQTTMGIILLSFVFSCQSEYEKESSNTLLKLVSSDYSGIHFQNKIQEKIHRNIGSYDYFYNGSGLGIGDLNGDNLPDIVFAGNDCPNQIYFNRGELKFDQETLGSNGDNIWCTGVNIVDINQDGLNDIFMCVSGPNWEKEDTRNLLYINQGNEKFTEEGKKYGIDHNGLSSHAAFFDMDEDGDLDLWIINHSIRNWANSVVDWVNFVKTIDPSEKYRFCSALYENKGNNQFVNRSQSIPNNEPGFGLGLSISDFNRDGLQDVFVGHDFFIEDKLYINQGKGKFEERSHQHFSHNSFYSMGSDVGDYNQDGKMDLMVLDMTPKDHYKSKTQMSSMNTDEYQYITKSLGQTDQFMFNSLYLNQSEGMMGDVALMSGVGKTDWSWSPLFLDLDNDSDLDLYISNGIFRDVKNNDWRLQLMSMHENDSLNAKSYFESLKKLNSQAISNVIFENKGDLNWVEGNQNFGIYEKSFSHGTAYGDLDGDGDLEIVVNNLNQEAFLYRNYSVEKGQNNFCQLTLHQNDQDYQGNAWIVIQTNQNMYHQEWSSTHGYQSCSQPLIHQGLNQGELVEQVFVRWGQNEWKEYHLEGNSSRIGLNFEDGNQSTFQFDGKSKEDRAFWNITGPAFNSGYFHQENDYDDFEKEVLLPHKMSMLGPGMDVGDLNGDGLDDIFIGGASGQNNVVYLQNNKASFEIQRQEILAKESQKEVLGIRFFDLDQDHDLDVYIACGGLESSENQNLNQDYILINDGLGNFSKLDLPKMNESTSSILIHDFDEDSDPDILVFCRNKPGEYPKSGQSFYLKNEGGQLNLIHDCFDEQGYLGMITDSQLMDYNQDGKKEILLTGEWMSPKILQYQDQKFTELTFPSIEEHKGWWYHISPIDFDLDGDEDYILGNLGDNNKFQPSMDNPLSIYAHDFDQNSSLDIVLASNYQGKMVPVRGRECSSSQMPFIGDKFPSYHEFASSSLDSIYGSEQLKESSHHSVNGFEHVVLINLGQGQWDIDTLENACQIAPVKSSVVYDFNNDKKNDLLLAGNQIQTEIETSSYDAGKGIFALGGDSRMEFMYPFDQSGFFVPNDVVEMKLIFLGKEKAPAVLVAKNNSRLNLFLWNSEFEP